MYIDERPKVKATVTDENVKANFEAERYPGCPLLDTNCEIKIERLCIAWADQEKLVRDIQGVIDKYKI